jgi:hypothetical protein
VEKRGFKNIGYAITLDDSHDVIILRDVLRQAAADRGKKLAKTVQAAAMKRNTHEMAVLSRYATRLEHIRIEEAKRIGRLLGTLDTPAKD